mmetsp:Transcript_46800/g.147102  ORF Transcript_46800/g.147102 Transcript_46800/m.147102 type:complete len:394 (+) Transcript_46800:839-2020(+)
MPSRSTITHRERRKAAPSSPGASAASKFDSTRECHATATQSQPSKCVRRSPARTEKLVCLLNAATSTTAGDGALPPRWANVSSISGSWLRSHGGGGGGGACGGDGLVVEQQRAEDEGHTREKQRRRRRGRHDGRGGAREHDGAGRRVHLDDVVRVLHHRGDEQPAEGGAGDDGPDEGRETLQRASSDDGGAVGEEQQRRLRDREEAQLHVAHPERGRWRRRRRGRGSALRRRRLLQHLLEVDVCEAGEERRTENGGHAEQRPARGRRAARGFAELDGADAEREEEEREPLRGLEPLAEQAHEEERGEERLGLRPQLVTRRLQGKLREGSLGHPREATELVARRPTGGRERQTAADSEAGSRARARPSLPRRRPEASSAAPPPASAAHRPPLSR